jgi:hypothetical protein
MPALSIFYPLVRRGTYVKQGLKVATSRII